MAFSSENLNRYLYMTQKIKNEIGRKLLRRTLRKFGKVASMK